MIPLLWSSFSRSSDVKERVMPVNLAVRKTGDFHLDCNIETTASIEQDDQFSQENSSRFGHNGKRALFAPSLLEVGTFNSPRYSSVSSGVPEILKRLRLGRKGKVLNNSEAGISLSFPLVCMQICSMEHRWPLLKERYKRFEYGEARSTGCSD